jgi:predicted heme/steroid binding protein
MWGMTLRQFTSLQLRRYNGEGRTPAYIAYRGKVYDVTGSRRWRDGLHEGLHWAGFDLTEYLANAPHGEEVFERYPVVGEMVS